MSDTGHKAVYEKVSFLVRNCNWNEFVAVVGEPAH